MDYFGKVDIIRLFNIVLVKKRKADMFVRI